MRKFVFSVIFLTTFISTSFSQSQKGIIDEVIWIVGDEAILRSDVEEQKAWMQYQGQVINGDPYCVIPEQIAINKLFLHQADLDSITVNESNVLGQVERQINNALSQVGTKEKLEEYLGKSLADYREGLITMYREQSIIQQMQEKLIENIKSTPSDIRRYFNQLNQDSIPVMPAQVELQIISFEPPVSAQEINRIKERLRDYSERITSGKTDFSILARLYSEDTESAKRGGELGFMGRGQLVPEFANVAFNLSDTKRVSRIVQTEFGFHIIQLIEKKGDQVNCRHILLKPHISLDDKNNGILRLDSISNLIKKNRMSFEQAVTYFSQDKNTAMNTGLMIDEKTGTSKFEYQDLPQEISKVVYNMNVGDISQPFSMINPATNKEVVAIVKVKSKTPNHKANLTDDFQMLRMMYESKKKAEFIKEWIIKKQKETYISIDPAWQNCNFEYPGWIKK
jgi:peptidyl-prolyl cis-trans isomerase SurA